MRTNSIIALGRMAVAALCAVFCIGVAAAQDGTDYDVVRFRLSAGTIGQNALRQNIEANTAALLTELNRANGAGGSLNFDGMKIAPTAKEAASQLWEYETIRVIGDTQNGKIFMDKPCLKIPGGYQVSPVEVMIRNRDTGEEQESAVAINFDGTGAITDFSITLSTEQIGKLMKAGLSDVRDDYARTMIVYWMGQLKNAYETRDISFFETIFSDDAVIITGTRRMQRTRSEVAAKMSQDQYVYYKKTKEEYINHLANHVFKVYDKITLEFGDDERIKQSVSKPRYYIVDVTQLWDAVSTKTGRRYSDEGRLFVLWDFADDEKPTILARVWQANDDPKRWDFIDFDNLE